MRTYISPRIKAIILDSTSLMAGSGGSDSIGFDVSTPSSGTVTSGGFTTVDNSAVSNGLGFSKGSSFDDSDE